VNIKDQLTIKSVSVHRGMLNKKYTLATAESITGGLLSATISANAGASSWFQGGAVTYTNHAKHKLLNIPKELITQHGAVSQIISCHMAQAIKAKLAATHALAITGIAGPAGATKSTPIGTVFITLVTNTGIIEKSMLLQGDRIEIQQQATYSCLELLHENINI
jgi:PncC family amidohydrolase